MRDKIVILMSTYNGEKYLREQLDSIVNQNSENELVLQIRDDGSSDNTIGIIKEFAEKQSKIQIKLSEGMNVGPQRSFLKLIKDADDADFYFFSDQDDIWESDKMDRAVKRMKDVQGQPVCYCSNYSVFNEVDSNIKENILDKIPQFTPLKILFYNQIPGCTMGFNRALMCLLKKLDVSDILMHDSVALSLCASTGTIIYDEKSCIRHRIHGDNVVGEGHKKIIPHKWIVEKTRLLFKKESYDLAQMADEFLKLGLIKDEFLDDICLLRDYKKSFCNTIKLLKHPDSHDLPWDRTTVSIRCKILFHIF